MIGTDIPVRETLACKAHRAHLGALNQGHTVGESMHALRLHLLRDNNLLGLAYTSLLLRPSSA